MYRRESQVVAASSARRSRSREIGSGIAGGCEAALLSRPTDLPLVDGMSVETAVNQSQNLPAVDSTSTADALR